jgi:hypothetical protein
METIEQSQVEQVQEHSVEPDTGVTVDANGLHESLAEIADTFDVTGFKCVKCGLAHMHDTTKHRLSDEFSAFDDSDAADMEYNSVCHCGPHEASIRGSEFGIDEGRAKNIADKAPIPPEESRAMGE